MWIPLSIFRSFIIALMILYLRYDNTPQIMFPLIINTIVGVLSLAYFTAYYKEHFASKFSNPKYYVYAVVGLFVHILGYHIIKTCPNPAYFRVFVALQIITLYLATLYITKEYEVSAQSMLGIICGCLAIILISLDKNNK
jgi:hypothetical protein